MYGFDCEQVMYEKASGMMARTLFSLLRMTKIPTIEVDIEENFEEGQNIFFLGNLVFFVWTEDCFYCMSSYLSSLFL